MKNRIITLLLIIFCLPLLLIYRGVNYEKQNSSMVKINQAESSKRYPRIVENIKVKNYNNIGKSETVYYQSPTKVVVVGENIIETMVALGLEKKILLAVTYGNKQYQPLPEHELSYRAIKIASNLALTSENILELEPDLIVSGQQLFSDKRLKDTQFWQNRGVNTFLSSNANSPFKHEHGESVEQELSFIEGLGKIFAVEEQAAKIISEVQASIERIKRENSGLGSPPKVMIVERLGGQIVTYDKNKLAGDMCTKIGAVVPVTGSIIGIEDILREDPDVLFVVKSRGDPELEKQLFEKLPAVHNLKAYKNDRIHGISLSLTYNTAIKTKQGLETFAKGIYPEKSKGL